MFPFSHVVLLVKSTRTLRLQQNLQYKEELLFHELKNVGQALKLYTTGVAGALTASDLIIFTVHFEAQSLKILKTFRQC